MTAAVCAPVPADNLLSMFLSDMAAELIYFCNEFSIVEKPVFIHHRKKNNIKRLPYQTQTAVLDLSKEKGPHFLWRLLASVVAIFTVSIFWAGIGITAEAALGEKAASTAAGFAGLAIIISIVAAIYFLFKKANKHGHLWLWQLVTFIVSIFVLASSQ